MTEKPRLGVTSQDKKAKDVEKKGPEPLTVPGILDKLHSLLMQVKISHYSTRSYAAHKAFNRTYKALDELIDSISEQVIGYTGERPNILNLSSILAASPDDMANMIVNFAKELEDWAIPGRYPNIENLAQELSGVGAELKYLATLT